MKNNRFFPAFLLALLSGAALHATHNYAGEIIFRKTGPLSVEAQIVTYTKITSVSADRDTLIICWGDGSCETVVRVNGPGNNGEPITSLLKKNIYTGAHTYASAQVYTISMTDPNRSAGIINVNPPQSENVPFHLQSTVSFLPEAANSLSSPELLQAPADAALVGQPFLHVPAAFDPDGDSLAYELVVPMQAVDMWVPNYSFPNQIGPGSNNLLEVSALSGKITWKSPQVAGEYVLAVLIKSYRNSQLVESVLRDMVIFVGIGANLPPDLSLNVPDEQIIDVPVGDTVSVLVQTSDPDTGQTVTLRSVSGLYGNFQSPAVFMSLGTDGIFHWKAAPEHVREQPYAVVFKAQDDGQGFAAGGSMPEQDPGEGLTTYKVVLFRVRQTVAAGEPVVAGQRLRVFPNPAPAMVTVDWAIPLPAEAHLQVLDALGRLTCTTGLSAGTTHQQLDTSGWPAGLYRVQLLTEGTSHPPVWLLKN